MAKAEKVITNCASVAIIYRKHDPSQIFLEVKNKGYPRKVFAKMGCLIGGNWAGTAAVFDWCPRDTLIREIKESSSFNKARLDLVELNQLHGVSIIDFRQSRDEFTPLPQDENDLQYVIDQIDKNIVPYRAHIVTVPEKLFRLEESNYSRGDIKTLVSYYTIGLSEEAWTTIERLQAKFGNLSNESTTLITSLEKIVDTGFQISWGHDQALRRFFLENGLNLAEKMRMVPGISTVYIGTPANSYKSYTERYRFKITPFG